MANPNPSPETRFEPGQSGNPGGLTSEQRQRIAQNAEKAAKLQSAMLDALMLTAFDEETGEVINGAALSMLAADPQRFLKEAMDRGFGTATQSVQHTGRDGGPIQTEEVGAGARKLEAFLDRTAKPGRDAGEAAEG